MLSYQNGENRIVFFSVAIIILELLRLKFSGDEIIIEQISRNSIKKYISKKTITINKEAHISMIPEENIVTNITIHKQYMKFPKVGEIYDYEDEFVNDFTNYTWLYVWNLSYQYYSTLNCYANGEDDTGYLLDSWFRAKGTFRVIQNFQDCVAITAPFGYGYGDFTLGILTRIVHCPVELLKKYPIIITGNGKFLNHAKAVLEAIGVTDPKIALVDTEFGNNLNFCNNLYTVLPNFVFGSYGSDRKGRDVHHSVYGPFASKLGDIMRNFYGIDKIKPTNYVVYNRPKGQQRTITNIDEIFSTLSKEFPKYTFTKLEGVLKTTKDTVINFGMAKWLFSVCGSNLLNCFYMAKHSGVLAFMPKGTDECFPDILATRELFFVLYKDFNAKMYHSPVTVEVKRFLKYAKRSLQILEDQHL